MHTTTIAPNTTPNKGKSGSWESRKEKQEQEEKREGKKTPFENRKKGDQLKRGCGRILSTFQEGAGEGDQFDLMMKKKKIELLQSLINQREGREGLPFVERRLNEGKREQEKRGKRKETSSVQQVWDEGQSALSKQIIR